MNVNGVGQSAAVKQVVSRPVFREVSDAGQVSRGGDRLELSGMGHLSKLLQQNDIRGDKVAQVKAQIEQGTYEDSHKLDVAVDRLLDDLG